MKYVSNLLDYNPLLDSLIFWLWGKKMQLTFFGESNCKLIGFFANPIWFDLKMPSRSMPRKLQFSVQKWPKVDFVSTVKLGRDLFTVVSESRPFLCRQVFSVWQQNLHSQPSKKYNIKFRVRPALEVSNARKDWIFLSDYITACRLLWTFSEIKFQTWLKVVDFERCSSSWEYKITII